MMLARSSAGPTRWLAALLIAALSATACTVKPKRSDTGFTGTWGRKGPIGDYQSTVAIAKQGERYLFRWKLDAKDRSWSVRCDWEGLCEERLDGKKIAEYKFEVTQKPGENFLTVTCTRTPVEKGINGFRYVDDLVLEPGGLNMTSYTRELNDRTYPRDSTMVKSFDKVSDRISEPPAGQP
jgi:hypothetical protein